MDAPVNRKLCENKPSLPFQSLYPRAVIIKQIIGIQLKRKELSYHHYHNFKLIRSPYFIKTISALEGLKKWNVV